MKKFNVFRYALFLALVAIATSCAKDGDTGPQGPPGPAGAAGAAGPAGPQGPIGAANVIYSNWLDVTFQESTAGSGTYIGQITAPKLTTDIIDKGEIKVYWNLSSTADPLVAPLPYFDGATVLNPLFDVGTIVLVTNADDVGTVTTTSGVKVQQYRYVLIPGGAPARMATVDWNNYEAVKKYLNLKD